MSKENQEAYDTAMAELDAIEKSGKSEEDELDALTKSLEAELGEYLSKGHKEPDGDEGKDDNADDKDGKKDADDKGKDPDDMGKSQDDLFDEELVKASELYASLEKSVHEGIGSVHEELDTVKKSLAALMNLNIKQAKVIAEMVKSRQGENESIAKSLAALAGAPIAPNQAKIGIAGEQEEQIKKSVSEITELLIKSVQEGSIDARYLSLYGTHKTLECLPESVRKTIGL